MTIGRLSFGKSSTERRRLSFTFVWRRREKHRGLPYDAELHAQMVRTMGAGPFHGRLATYPRTSGWILDLIVYK